MKLHRLLLNGILLSATLVAATAQAYTGSISASDRSQQGRLSRNGVPQDFAGDEGPFPGVINTTTTYRYETFYINVGNTPYVEITIDTPTGNVFGSGYQTSYRPNSSTTGNRGFDTNWLGDAGQSNFAFDSISGLVDAGFFDVVALINSTLVVVVNTTGAGGLGIGDTFTLLAQGFTDADFDNPRDLAVALVPEPSTLALLALAPLGWAITRRRRQRSA